MKHLTWNGVGLLSASLLLGMLGGCGDNPNDVGIFDEGPGTGGSSVTGEVSNTDGSNASSTDAGETESTSSGVGGTGQSDGATGGASTEGTSAGGSGATDAGSDAGDTGGATSTSTGVGGSGGNTGSGGATAGSGGTTTGSGGSGGGDACPLERPIDNSPCEPNQLECIYVGQCGEETLVCVEGQWTRRASDARTCASFTRETFPQDGDSCACTPELRCEFLDCDGRGRILAQCNGDTWQIEAEPCEVRPCGPETGEQPRCSSDQICVVTAVGAGEGYTCEDNPCAEANLPNSCECARSVCPSDAFECNMHENDTVLACTCPDCQ